MKAIIYSDILVQREQLQGLVKLLYPHAEVEVSTSNPRHKDIIELRHTGGNSSVPELEIEVFKSRATHIKHVLSMNIFSTSGFKTNHVEVSEYI